MNAIRNPFTYRIPVIKLAGKELQSAKSYAILLVLVMFAGIFSFSSAISSVRNSVVIESIGQISTTSVTARSGSPEDIQAAVDAVVAVGGSTVYVPEGDFEFDIDPNKTDSHGYIVGVIIPGGINIIGAGKDKTILRQPKNPPRDSRMFHVDGQNNLPVRISGIKFIACTNLTGYENPVDGEGAITQRGICLLRVTDFRVDHCSFIDFSGTAVIADNRHAPRGVNRGVVDHCDFDLPYKDIWGGPTGTKWGYGVCVGGTQQWDDWQSIDHYLGKYDGVNDIIYIEDCNFSRTRHAVTSNGGGFYVVRHCIFTEPRPRHYAPIDVHGLAGYDGPGGRGLEAYDNTIIGDGATTPAFWIRGGGGVIYNNSINDCSQGIGLSKEGDIEENWVHDLWIWGNSMNMGTMLVTNAEYVENQDYFLYEKAYTPYPYPHPLTLEATP